MEVPWRLTCAEEGLEEKAGRQRRDSHDGGNFNRWREAEYFTERGTCISKIWMNEKTNILGKEANNVLLVQRLT